MTTITAARSLDRRGKTITTLVVFDLATELESMRQGEILEVLTDHYEPFQSDIAAWCEAVGHSLVAAEPIPEGLRFLVKKGTAKTKDTNLAMVISSDGLEELLSPLSFAQAATLEGIETHLYFQGPAVRVLRRGFRPRLTGWARRPFSRFAAAGMNKTGHIPAQEKLRQLRKLGANIYMCGPSMEHFRVDRNELIFDDLPMIEYLTFMSIMERAEIQLYI